MKKPVKPQKFDLPEPQPPDLPNERIGFWAHKPDPWWYDEFIDLDKQEFKDWFYEEKSYANDTCFTEGFTWDDVEELLKDDSLSYEDIEKILTDSGEYQPTYSSDVRISYKDALKKVPQEHRDKMSDLHFMADYYHLYDREYTISIWVSYSIPNENFEKEKKEYGKKLAKYKKDLKAWKMAKKKRTEENKKYRADMKKYKAWIEEKIKELEGAE